MDAVIAKLKTIKRGVRNKLLRKVLKRAAVTLKDQMKADVVRETGALAQSIAQKVVVKGNRASAIVGPRAKWSVKKRGKEKIPNKYARKAYPGLKSLSVTGAVSQVQADTIRELESLASV